MNPGAAVNMRHFVSRFERTFGTFCSFRTELAFRMRSVFFRTWNERASIKRL